MSTMNIADALAKIAALEAENEKIRELADVTKARADIEEKNAGELLDSVLGWQRICTSLEDANNELRRECDELRNAQKAIAA